MKRYSYYTVNPIKVACTALLVLLCSTLSNAQSWQWGLTGGGISDTYLRSLEQVTHTTTDKHGNVYAVSQITNATYMVVDGHSITLPLNTDATVLFSYSCDGTFRWGKVMQIGKVSGLAADTLGGLYIAGNINSNTFFLGDFDAYDADTLVNIISSAIQTLAMVKLDTLGNKEWIRMPQPDTVAWNSPQSASMDLEVEKDGNIHWLCELTPGNYEGSGLIVNSRGIYVLRYDRNGDLTGNTEMAMLMPASYVSPGMAMLNYTKANNRYVITGAYMPGDPALTIGGVNVNQPLYVASFNATTGSSYWLRQSSAYSTLHAKSVTDAENNIYVSGTLGHGYSFNGFTQNNLYTTIPHLVPFLQKMDENGNAIWTHGTGGTTQINPLGLTLSGQEIAVTGGYGSHFGWDNGTESFFTTSSTSAINIFLTRFNKNTGNYVKTDTLGGTPSGGFEYGFCVAGDRSGNYYVGGKFDINIIFNGSIYYKAGGASDFFLAKFGTGNCSGSILTGITDADARQPVSVYPNPAGTVATITLPNALANAAIRLYSITGEKVLDLRGQAGTEILLDLSGQSAGMYLLEVKQQSGIWRTRIVKE